MPPLKDGFLEKLTIEWICLGKFIQFSRRNRRYFSIALALYAKSFLTIKNTTLIRAAYCFAQGMDDILDGDCAFSSDRFQFGLIIRKELNENKFSRKNNLSILADYLFHQKEYLHLNQKLIQLLDILLIDNQRMNLKLIFNKEQLRQHHFKTFKLSIELLMGYLNKNAPDDIIEPLSNALSWCSVMRDLEDDLTRGLNNIPNDVWESADNLLSPEKISTDPYVRKWIFEEYIWGSSFINHSFVIAENIEEPATKKILFLFIKAINKYHKNYCNKYQFIKYAN